MNTESLKHDWSPNYLNALPTFHQITEPICKTSITTVGVFLGFPGRTAKKNRRLRLSSAPSFPSKESSLFPVRPPDSSTPLWFVPNKNRDIRLGHSLVRSHVRSHRSLVRLLRTACFTRALRCAHSFTRLLTSLTPSLVGK